MLANISMSARTATRYCGPGRVTVACSAHLEASNARPCKCKAAAVAERPSVSVAGPNNMFRSLECMSAIANTSRREAVTFGLGVAPWALVPVVGAAAEALWPNHVLAYGVPLAILSFASAIAAVIVGRPLGGARSRLKAVRWGYSLGGAFLAMWFIAFFVGVVFAAGLRWWPALSSCTLPTR